MEIKSAIKEVPYQTKHNMLLMMRILSCPVLSCLVLQVGMPAPSAASLQVTRHARRVYVGGLPIGTSELLMTQFFNSIMLAAQAVSQPGAPVISCYMNHDKRFAFVEFR
jgi:hypothetical protein